MSKVYQPIVIKNVDLIIEALNESNFFIDYELESTDFAKEYFSDRLTEKFIKGELVEDEDLFTEDEMNKYLKEIIAGSLLYELKNKGLINSYEDDNTEEIFFLTEEGKEYMKNKLKD
jgi:hypothetical protein